ncbi:UNVERIFIED_CONTAM: hypothetical protein Sangu_1446400 [Sesamum angustifolium]|uniref:Uncharacterized protein n=1 Tax=Sesamum angustifolium TaxID=2727405 RepID=A0AAW2N7W0_9LAMI
MKASLTLHEDPKNPFVKAKIPLTIFGVPFCSGVEAGDYKELCISFSTAFRSGPLLRFSYRPNDSCRQFGVTLRTGIGKFGSPAESPISITAEFSSTERLTWNQLFCRAYGVLTEGEMRATTSVPVNHAVVRLGWSMKFLPPVATAEGGGGGSWAELLSKELPYLVLRKIAIEHVAGDKAGKGKKWERR